MDKKFQVMLRECGDELKRVSEWEDMNHIEAEPQNMLGCRWNTVISLHELRNKVEEMIAHQQALLEAMPPVAERPRIVLSKAR